MLQIQENWRYFFYYVFGLLPSVFFSLRFLIQWLNSEKKKESSVGSTFWYLSLCGNVLCSLHYFIQLQYLLMMIQVINGFISWRNLKILNKKEKLAFKTSLYFLITLLGFSSALFFAQFFFVALPVKILEIPFALANDSSSQIHWFWHLFGGAGCLLFASRFWIQWIEAEKSGESKLNKNFWLLSIFGSLIALAYFLHIRDWISSLNYSFGLIPYLRNLMLSRKPI